MLLSLDPSPARPMLRPLRDHVLSWTPGLQQKWQLIMLSISFCVHRLRCTQRTGSPLPCLLKLDSQLITKLRQHSYRVALVPERRKTHQPHTGLLSSARSKCKTSEQPLAHSLIYHTPSIVTQYKHFPQDPSLPILSMAAFCFRTTSSVYMASTFQCQSVFVIRGILNQTVLCREYL